MIGVSDKGAYDVVFNSDNKEFGGKGISKKRVYRTKKQPMHGMDQSIDMTLPPLSTIYLKYRSV